MIKKTIKANSRFVCPVCGSVEYCPEHGEVYIYSHGDCPIGIGVAALSICSDCTCKAFEILEKYNNVEERG